MDKFKPGDVVFHLIRKEFARIKKAKQMSIDEYWRMHNVEKHLWFVIREDGSHPHINTWDEPEMIKVEPDTPQKRLEIMMRHSS